MNKKFLTGTILGLIMGLSIGTTLPMIGATDIKMPTKKKTINTTSKTQTIKETQIKVDSTEQMKEILKVLNEINENSNKNIEQNETMIKHLDSIAKRSGF